MCLRGDSDKVGKSWGGGGYKQRKMDVTIQVERKVEEY